ncbi:hypothetical protein BSL78_09916 [Apostichopus japonicus]|uniref:Reverse transcriptase domain-containing protein n=1 Tax=Stichopus japonicus TaxID=307972 RepID=A0A2G8KYW3_STIJA|nr:hypothetical protein BSL78_09916 [Apostichopus japonicus]
MRNRMRELTAMVQENLAAAQDQQKEWYDRTARSRCYGVGQQVLVFLPTASGKLQAEWQGPYPITNKISDTDYEIDTGLLSSTLISTAREKSAFITPFGLFEYLVMPFGMRNAPATFQRLVDNVLQGCEEFAKAYIDDIVIFSKTWEEHLCHLEAVFNRLEKSGLAVKPDKCRIGEPTVPYLGYVIGSGEVRPEECKVEAIINWPTPLTKTDVRSFLGLTGYYRKLIPDFAQIASPLTDLTKKSKPTVIEWTEGCEQAFLSLKKLITCKPVLKSPDFEKDFILQCDASERDHGVSHGHKGHHCFTLFIFGINKSRPVGEERLGEKGSAGCPNLNTPGNGSLRCDEWQYGKLCFQECDQTYDIPPGSMFPNLFVCGTAGIWTPGNVPDCIMPIEAKGLVLEAELRLYAADCDDVIKTKSKEAFDKLIKSVDVLAVCEWPEGCAIENVSVDCAPAVHIETTMGTDMRLHDGGMNVIDTSDGGAAQDEPYWYQRAQDGGSQPRVRRDEAGLNSLGNHHDWGYTLNISFSFSLNFSAESLQSGTGYDWLTYLGSKELYDSAVFMQTQIESRMISLEIPDVDWEFQDDSFHYEFVSPYCSAGFMPSWKTMKCSACVAGTYHNQTSEDCIACPLGSYQDEAGQESCKPCPNSGTTEEGKMADSLQSCI